ncbi:MAG: SusD/RagB family nutrient-binding outer membrane lipoprotein [Tannerellaceae bacterium]|nr:SusD/RagB family nutrient-binding outer membrane lipoprotein [Tannerellaceae bacterium]
MGPIAEINLIYEQLGDNEKKQYEPYIKAGKIISAFNTAIATDFFCNMPYSEAFTARSVIYGGTPNFRPKYDTQQEIYYAILKDLEEAANYFKTASGGDDIFNRQDILYQGDMDGWYRFANSLRIRYAMRISDADESKAKEVLASVPLDGCITTNAKNAVIRVSDKNYAPEGLWTALYQSHRVENGYYAYAPEPMVNLLEEAGDIRLKLFFQPASDDDGIVYDTTLDIIPYPISADQAIQLVNRHTDSTDDFDIQKIYGVTNSYVFLHNYYLPVGIGMTAAETYLCLAEAAHRNLISGDAEEYYNKGIILSIQNYYDYYANSTAEEKYKMYTIPATEVTDAALTTWLASSSMKFNPAQALQQIATQKWLHLNYIQAYETWAEVRRSDLDILVEDREGGKLLNDEEMPVRLLLPATEASMNPDNYSAQSAYNKQNVRLWWDVK